MASFKLVMEEGEYPVAIDEDEAFLCTSDEIEAFLAVEFDLFMAGKYLYSHEEALVDFVSTLDATWFDKPQVPRTPSVPNRIY